MIHILQLSTSLCHVVVILNEQRIWNKETNKKKISGVDQEFGNNQRSLWHITYSLQCIIEITSPSTTNAEYNNIPSALSGTSSAPEWNSGIKPIKSTDVEGRGLHDCDGLKVRAMSLDSCYVPLNHHHHHEGQRAKCRLTPAYMSLQQRQLV